MFRYVKDRTLKFDDHRGRHGGHRHHMHGGRHGFRHRGWAGEGEERGRRRRVFDSGELRLVLLKLIADQPRHGYELIRAIAELSGGVYAPSPGMIYPMLTMLHEMGQIEEVPSSGARKAFSIAAAGSEHLAAHKADLEALFERLAAFASARERTDGGPLRRAMQNLRAVIINRFDRDDAAPDSVHQAAAILDEAAQRIERL
jgi:DNA-binding PadR family transcriptional regulator